MEVDQDVIKITTGTAITKCRNNNTNDDIKIKQDDKLIIIDPESTESSSSEESDDDVQVIKQYKLDDVRPVIGNYGKCSNVLSTSLVTINIYLNLLFIQL